MHELREAIWEQVPPDALPERFAERRALLLSAVAGLGNRGVADGDDGQQAEARRGHRPEARSDLPAPLRILDAGCGAGAFAAALLETGAEVVAADASEGALALTAQAAPAAERVLWLDGGALAVPSASIDLAWAGETIEHVGDGEAWLGELHRALKPGGRLLLTAPDHPFLRRLRLALSRRAFDDHFAPWRDHLRFFTAASLAELLERAGFEAIEIHRAYGRPWARETLVATARRGGG